VNRILKQSQDWHKHGRFVQRYFEGGHRGVGTPLCFARHEIACRSGAAGLLHNDIAIRLKEVAGAAHQHQPHRGGMDGCSLTTIHAGIEGGVQNTEIH